MRQELIIAASASLILAGCGQLTVTNCAKSVESLNDEMLTWVGSRESDYNVITVCPLFKTVNDSLIQTTEDCKAVGVELPPLAYENEFSVDEDNCNTFETCETQINEISEKVRIWEAVRVDNSSNIGKLCPAVVDVQTAFDNANATCSSVNIEVESLQWGASFDKLGCDEYGACVQSIDVARSKRDALQNISGLNSSYICATIVDLENALGNATLTCSQVDETHVPADLRPNLEVPPELSQGIADMKAQGQCELLDSCIIAVERVNSIFGDFTDKVSADPLNASSICPSWQGLQAEITASPANCGDVDSPIPMPNSTTTEANTALCSGDKCASETASFSQSVTQYLDTKDVTSDPTTLCPVIEQVLSEHETLQKVCSLPGTQVPTLPSEVTKDNANICQSARSSAFLSI